MAMAKNDDAPRTRLLPPLAMPIRRKRKGKRIGIGRLLIFILLQQIGNIFASTCTFQAAEKGAPPPFNSSSSSSSFFSPFSPSQIDPFSLAQCSCELDWANSFCARMDIYAQMHQEKAPSVCVCRQLIGQRECRQFLSRCFPRPSKSAQFPQPHPQHRPLVKREAECGCCFNQPDKFCTQLECHKMRPKFDVPNTQCRCFLPQQRPKGEYPPQQICGQGGGHHWPRGIDQNEELPPPISPTSPPHPHQKTSSSNLARLFRSNAPYVRFVSFLLLALLASILLAVLVCFWSHWRRIRRGRRKAKVEAEQPVTSTSQLNGEEEERTMTTEGGRRVASENGAASLLLLQEATV